MGSETTAGIGNCDVSPSLFVFTNGKLVIAGGPIPLYICRNWAIAIFVAKGGQLELYTPPSSAVFDIVQEFVPKLIRREHLWIAYDYQQASGPGYGDCIEQIC